MKTSVLVVASVLCFTTLVRADGLFYRLPEDGTWVEYQEEFSAEFRVGESQEWTKVEGISTHRVSSVGVVVRAKRPCRWIECSSKTWVKGREEPVGDFKLRVLVPERYLTRGEDPLSHAILTFWNTKDGDRAGLKDEPGFDRFSYERDRFLITCPPPLASEKSHPDETIETSLGRFVDCEVITGMTHFDRPTKDEGRWEHTVKWRIALHDDAPFGVVQLHAEWHGVETTSAGEGVHSRAAKTMTLSKSGNDAESTFVSDEENQPAQPPASEQSFKTVASTSLQPLEIPILEMCSSHGV